MAREIILKQELLKTAQSIGRTARTLAAELRILNAQKDKLDAQDITLDGDMSAEILINLASAGEALAELEASLEKQD
jgi:hypothetical protein